MSTNAHAGKTEAQLQQEVGALFHEIGARTYTRHLIDSELAQLNAKLYETNVELHNRRQARAAVEAEAKAAAEAAAEADRVVMDAEPATEEVQS